MSRVGKYPIVIPSGVTVGLENGKILVKGKLGQLQAAITEHVLVTVENDQICVAPNGNGAEARMMWGTTRALVANMVEGVSKGYQRLLEINGTGFRAAVQGAVLVLNLGYSHDINFPIPDGIKISTPRPTAVLIEGVDKRQVGQIASEIRAYRAPEPYKGKGVKYEGEKILRKEGKKK